MVIVGVGTGVGSVGIGLDSIWSTSARRAASDSGLSFISERVIASSNLSKQLFKVTNRAAGEGAGESAPGF